MRRALTSFVALAVGAAVLALPAAAVHAIEPPRVRVTPGVSSVLAGETRQLNATVTNLTNTDVTWSVRSGGGTVSATGLYTPPAQVPATPVAVVRAAAVEDPTVYGEATVAIASGVPGGAFGAELPTNTGGGQDADMGDINGDGKTDVVIFQNCCNSLSVGHLVTLTWNGTSLVRGGPAAAVSTYQENGFTATSDHLLDIELGDLDGDGDLDVYVPFGSVQAQYWRYQVWRNDGTGTFTPDPRVKTIGGARSGARARLTDFDGDGKLDAVRMEWFGTLLFEKGNGDGSFQEPVTLMSTFDADTFDIGDLTGDGRPEIAVGIKGMSNSSTTIEVGINNGFGGIASKVTYDVGMAPEPRIADSDGDGWNDLVVGIGGEQYSNASFAPKLMAHRNLGTGTGAVATTGVQLLDWRPRGMEAVHVDGDGVLDLAGFTYRGPVLLRRTAPNTYDQVHAASGSIHHATFGDVTGDGRLDTFTNWDSTSRFWPGSADLTPAFAVAPGVTRINATHTASFTAVLRNSPVEPKVTWSASRGTFNETTYTAPATASPSGTPVTITAALTGTTTTATRGITVVNERFQFTSLGGMQVRQLVTDPQQATHVYAATSNGVYRSTSGGVSFAPLGTTGSTGVDARQLAVVRDPMGTLRVLAVFGTTLYRIDVGTGDWVPAGAPGGVTSVSVLPNTPIVWIVAGGAVHRSTDGGTGWTPFGQTNVTRAEPIDPSSVWLLRSTAPRVARGTVVTTPSAQLDVVARELPVPAAVVNAIAVHPGNRALAYVATNDAANPLFRDAGGTGNAGSPMWSAVPTPGVVDRLAVSGTGAILAARAGTLELYKSTDEGAAWHSLNRGFTSVTAQAVAHRVDGLDLVGTSAGLYTPVESTPPAAPAVTGGPAGTTGPGTANSFSFTFDAVTDAASYLCALDDNSWAACTSPKAYSGPLASGSHTFSVVALDSNGNESAPGTRTWTVDATPAPVPSILTGPSGTVNTATATFTFELTGDATGATCSLDNATPAPCASGVSYPSLGQGAHTFAVRSLDPAGNASAPATRSWSVDTVPPGFPSFWSWPRLYSPNTWATFRWQTDSTATYTCTLDGGGVPCSSSSATVTNLGEGQHTFAVTASDAAGNAAVNEYTWTVDLTDPGAPVISVKPDTSTNATTARFEFASPSDDVSHYWCTIDGQTDYCYGERDYVELAAGNHTFEVRAFDRAGRQSPVTSYAWTIAVPAPVITGGPGGFVNSRTATFTFTTVEGATTTCSLDGAAPAPCTSGVTYNAVPDGAHTFSVFATKNGATSEPATRQWIVDATPPDAPELTAVPPARTSSSSAAFAWTPDPALTYTCALDGAPVSCAAGSYQTTVAQGAHQFVLTARDAGLNTATATYQWTVDQTGPTVSMSAKPPARTASTGATFEFGSAAADLHHYVCTIDAVAANCTSPVILTSLVEGEHTFSVVGYDDLGNPSVPVSHAWTVDRTGPAVAITAKPAARTGLTSATFEFSSGAPDLAGFVCTIDGVTYSCGSPAALSSLAPGTHTFSVVAKDDVGNLGSAATHTWVVDQSGPPATLVAAPPPRTKASTATFEFSSADPDVASFVCTVDGAESACTSPLMLSSLAPGTHTFSVFARDDVGNTGAPVEHSWTVDQAGPAVTLTAKPPARTAQTFATFGFSSQAADLHHYVCTVDGVVTDACGAPVELTGLAAGEHTFAVVAYDDLGNSGAPATHRWTVDLTAPDVSITVKPAALSNDPTPLFEFASSADDLAEFSCELDGNTLPCASPWTDVPELAPGQHVLRVRAIDDVRNVSEPVEYVWTVDLTAPTATIAAPGTALNARPAVSFDEPVAGVSASTVRLLLTGTTTAVPATVACRTAAGAAVACTAGTVRAAVLTPSAPLVPGQLYTVSVSGVTDLAGNAAAAATAAFRASVSEQENGLAARPTWRRVASSAAKGGSYHLSDAKGATATYSFTGTSVTWYGLRGPSFGLADVYVDGKLKVSKVNFYSSGTASLARTITGLTNAKHTLRIVVRGERGSTSGTGTNVAVDAFKVGSTVSATPAVTWTWGRTAATAASGGAYAVEDATGATFTMTFRGRGIDWVTVLGPTMGKATVSIDGVSKGTFDNWASAPKYGVVRRFGGLADKVHTLKITVTGQRRSGATGTNVAVDRFGILA